MIAVALKGILGRKFRTVLTALAIVLGVSMISGTYVLTDTINAAFTKVLDSSYKNADAVISGKVAFENNNSDTQTTPAFSDSVLTKVKQLPDTAAASGAAVSGAAVSGAAASGVAVSGAPASGAAGAAGGRGRARRPPAPAFGSPLWAGSF